MPNKIDMTGKRIGRLIVLTGAAPKVYKSGKIARWVCQCDCGKQVTVLGMSLRNGDTRSCGCYNVEAFKQRATTHGLSKHPLYAVWKKMKRRCLNPNDKRYKDWGGRGISVCQEWVDNFLTFYNFCMSNGWKKGLQIDRIDNNGNYSPENCRFVTARKNVLNSRLIRNTNTSGYRGVSRDKRDGKWYVNIGIKGLQIRVPGCFCSKEEAAKARNRYIVENNLQEDYRLQGVG